MEAERMSLNLLPSDGAEVCFLLLGAAVGVCYGLDGWTGTQKDTELNRTTRLKNLKYAVGGLFLTLIADLKSVGLTTSKLSLLQYYIEGFSFAGSAAVVFVGFCLYCKYEAVRRTDLAGFLPQSFSPVLDYLLYGFNFYRSTSEKTLKDAQEKREAFSRDQLAGFLPAYARQLSNAIAAISFYTENGTEGVRKEVAIQILKCIRAVVVEGYQKQNGLFINANYMVAHHKDSLPANFELEKRLRFAQKGKDEYEYFLALEGYADDDGKEQFVLPVESKNTDGWEARLLPGAPQAFSKKSTVLSMIRLS